jgi:hypothetical protein
MADLSEPPPFWSAAEATVWRRLFDATLGPAVAPAAEAVTGPVREARSDVPPGPVELAVAGRASSRVLPGPVRLMAVATLLRGLFRPDRPGEPNLPRSGGLASLTPYVSVVDVPELPVGLYRADGRRLERTAAPAGWPALLGAHVNLYLGRSGQPAPPVVLLWRVEWRPIMTRYPCCGLLTAFWDAGAALQASYLLAAEAGLGGCACAGLPTADLIAELGWDPWESAFVGAFAIGQN